LYSTFIYLHLYAYDFFYVSVLSVTLLFINVNFTYSM